MSEINRSPVPDADALAHSARVSRHIRQRIAAAGGWIDFRDYMDLALYAPGLGYYSAGAQKFGAAGDFVTAPEISALFSRCVARACLEVEFDGGGPPTPVHTILELGAGSGAMAVEILQTLQRLDAVPERYLILEVSADLRERQRRLLTATVPDLSDRVVWLDALPSTPISGVIIANEVLDALPVTRFAMHPGEVDQAEVNQREGIQILGAEATASGFGWSRRPATAERRERILEIKRDHGRDWPDGYSSEYCPATRGFIGGLSQSLARGLILLIDYGMSARDYYAPGRSGGTLACHYRHRRHTDPFFYPGLQDITAWVDFSRVADAAGDADLNVLGFTTQAQFLVAAGIEQEHARLMENPDVAREPREQLRIAAGLKTLLMPGEMGENFKVLALGRELAHGPASVCRNDRLHLL